MEFRQFRYILTDLQKAAAAIDTTPVQNGIHKKIAAG